MVISAGRGDIGRQGAYIINAEAEPLTFGLDLGDNRLVTDACSSQRYDGVLGKRLRRCWQSAYDQTQRANGAINAFHASPHLETCNVHPRQLGTGPTVNCKPCSKKNPLGRNERSKDRHLYIFIDFKMPLGFLGLHLRFHRNLLTVTR